MCRDAGAGRPPDVDVAVLGVAQVARADVVEAVALEQKRALDVPLLEVDLGDGRAIDR